MMAFLEKLFRSKSSADYRELLNRGAVIVDVRTEAEYREGHISGSLNLPLQVLHNHLSKLRKDKPIITCCASGMRSMQAQGILLKAGFDAVHDGGGWQGLHRKINQE